MKLDDLKATWQQEIAEPDNQKLLDEVLPQLKTETTKLDKSIKRRDILEISIAILLIPVWIWDLFHSVSSIQSLGLIILILACIYIPYRLIKAKKIDAPIDNSILEFLSVEKQKLEQQKQLLESVAWWYISPMMLGILLVTAGAKVDEFGLPQIGQNLIIYYLFCALLVAGIYLLNKKAAKNKFKPLLDKINQQLKEIKE